MTTLIYTLLHLNLRVTGAFPHASKENVKIKLGFGIYSFSAILMRGMHAKKGDNLFALILKCHRIQGFLFVV